MLCIDTFRLYCCQSLVYCVAPVSVPTRIEQRNTHGSVEVLAVAFAS